jgi:putative ABC transport system permease protein
VSTLFPGDGVVTSPATQPELVAEQLQHTAGAGETGMVRFFNLDLEGHGVGFAAIDPGLYLRHGGLRFSAGDRLTALELLDSAPSVVVPEDLAAAYGWRFGDHLSLPTVDGTADVIVEGVVEHSFPAGDGRESVLIGRNVARHLAGPLAAGFDDLLVAGGGADSALRTAAAGYGMQLVRVETIRESADAAVAHSVGLLLAVAVVTVLLAVLAVVTTLLVNIRQGMRDLGLLRAVGLSRRRARQLIRAEALLLALAGTVAGIAGGTLVALPMTRVIAGPGFAPEFSFPAMAALAAAAAILAISLLAAALPSRRVTSASIVAAVRHD